MSDKTIPPDRGGSIYQVSCLRKDANTRTATAADFFTVHVRAPNALSARLAARNECSDCANAFEAKLVRTDAKYVAIIGGHRIATSAALVEHYQRAFRNLPVDFAPIADADQTRGEPE